MVDFKKEKKDETANSTEFVGLSSCVSCGGLAELEDCRLMWLVRCVSCGFVVLGERAPEPESESQANKTDWGYYKSTAITAWNESEV